MTETVLVVPGDGIGQEVVPAAVEVLEAVADFEFVEADAGDHVQAETGEALPEETYRLATEADATLFGAAGETAADVILPLREAVGSFANVRPARAYPGVDALRPETDLVFVRENTEGVYSGIESEIADGVTTLTRVVTEDASRRIAEYGFEYAEANGYDDVTVAHKANVMRTTDGQFLEAVRDVADERAARSRSRDGDAVSRDDENRRFSDHAADGASSAEPRSADSRAALPRDDGETASAGGADHEEALMDALAMHLLLRPEEYGVVICPNLAGDLLSDLAAGLVGGLGLLPSANVGPENALFEPVHGSAPDIAGEGVANPAATVLSAAMLLEHLGYDEAAASVREAVESVLADGPRTPDLGGSASTADVTAAIVDRL